MTAAWDSPRLPARFEATAQLPLVGRRAELEVFDALWPDVDAGRRQLVLVGGEPGAGKTRLVAEVARALHADNVTVLVGTCSADAGVPYQPFTEMLDAFFRSAHGDEIDALLEAHGRELRRISAEVARLRPGEEPGAEERELRRDLFDAVARTFETIARAQPLSLIFDDLHWAQMPTLALLEHVVQVCHDSRLLVLATFRTTAPDRSGEFAARIAELHRFEGVRRVDLGGLDTDAIAEYVSLRTGMPLRDARTPAALLRDRTGGNPFFLRELWSDLERQGGVAALRTSQRVPASIGDSVAARVAGLGPEVRRVIELAAVLGDQFDLATLIAASESDMALTMGFVDAATALGLIEALDVDGGRYSFVHALTRQAVLDQIPASRRQVLHARAAEAIEQQPRKPSSIPRLAHHCLAAHVLGFGERALRYSREAAMLAERTLAFEEAAVWFERAAALPECDERERSELLLAAAGDLVRASDFVHARAIYESLALTGDPIVRLLATMGFEDAAWRPGLFGPRAADLLAMAIEECGLDERDRRYVCALGSLGRALSIAGETARARVVGTRAIELARALDDEETIAHTLVTSLWHGTTADVAELQLERATEVYRIARSRKDYETLGAAGNFRSMVAYLLGLPDILVDSTAMASHAAEQTGQPYYRYVACGLAHALAFQRGEFAAAEQWAEASRQEDDTFGDDIAEGPFGVQMFMLRRETGGLDQFRPFLDGMETLAGRWVPGLLALYTELGIEVGVRRTLRHVMNRDLSAHNIEAQWPMELVFMTEGALLLDDVDALRVLRPLFDEFAGKNMMNGTLIACFGSADRYRARIADALGDSAEAERAFAIALEMDERMHAFAHLAETLAYAARFADRHGETERSRSFAGRARALAESNGQVRVLRLLEAVAAPVAARPDGLTDREVEVLRLLAAGLSNQEIGARLFISANTAANHVRSILMKTGAANRTQAAMYATRHELT